MLFEGDFDFNVPAFEARHRVRDGRWVNAPAAASRVIVDVTVQHAIGDLPILAE
jgi:hypothetical protein